MIEGFTRLAGASLYAFLLLIPGFEGNKAAVPEGRYTGTMTMRYQRIDNLAPGGFASATYPVVLAVKAPMTAPPPVAGEPEKNPFSLSITLQAERVDIPGTLRLHSANVRRSAEDGRFVVIQDWSYSLKGNHFEGSLTSPLNPVQTSWVTTKETGGPLPTCLAYMWQGSRLNGQFSGNQLNLTVSGKAGTAYVAEKGIVWGGGSCAMGAVIQFKATIQAKRAR